MKSKQKVKSVIRKLTIEAPGAESVHVAGTFNNWDASATPLTKDRNGVWKTRLKLPSGEHEYKFVIDQEWLTDPCNPNTRANGFGTWNSVFSGE